MNQIEMGHQENFILEQRTALSIVIGIVLFTLGALCCIFFIKMNCCQRWIQMDGNGPDGCKWMIMDIKWNKMYVQMQKMQNEYKTRQRTTVRNSGLA